MTLKERYTTEIQANLQTKLGVASVYQTPKLLKVSVNIGMGELKGNEPLQKAVEEGLSLITGQKPIKTRAKKAIAGFKLRENDIIGYRVTLRQNAAYDFLDRLITYVFPRIRDFQGFPLKGFDGRGNYSFGLKDQLVFPELPFTNNAATWGLQVTVVTSAVDKAGTKELLTDLGFPFSKEEVKGKGK